MNMKLLSEFRDFALKGNVVDLAVGVIIGAAFGKIVSALVENVLMPPIGFILGRVDFKDLAISLGTDKPVLIKYGVFIQTVVDFAIVAFVLFLVLKAMLTLKARFEKEKAAEAPPPPSPSEVYLKEIRDALVKK